MAFDCKQIEQTAAELIGSVGIVRAKAIMVRIGCNMGVISAPTAFTKDRVRGWRDGMQTFLTAQVFSEIELDLTISEKGDEQILHVQLSGSCQEERFKAFLWPWYLAGWCTGFSSSFLGKDIIFCVREAPSQESDECVLEGQEEGQWEEVNHEPLVDYHRFYRSELRTRSLAMRMCLDRLRDMSPGESPLFLQVELADNPQFLARFVHAHSLRKDQAFVYLDSISLDENIFENTLLTAKNGTLYISSIESLPQELQERLVDAMLLNERGLNIRLITSSSMSLGSLVREYRLVEELVRLLQGFEVLVPSLRMRMEDLIPHSRAYLTKLKSSGEISREVKFSPAVLNEFLHHEWPGGFRELKSVVQHMLYRRLEHEGVLGTKHLPNLFQNIDMPQHVLHLGERSLADVERRAILSTLQQTNGNKREAARMLNIGYNTLWRKLKVYSQRDKNQ